MLIHHKYEHKQILSIHNLTFMKILVIGAANMGFTYAEGMSKSKLLRKRNIMGVKTPQKKNWKS